MVQEIRAIKEFVIREFASDVTVDELESDYDLLNNGVIDSIGLLRTIAWLEKTFEVSLDSASPENLRTVESMHVLVTETRELMSGSPGADPGAVR